jgi:hypothetical protein
VLIRRENAMEATFKDIYLAKRHPALSEPDVLRHRIEDHGYR